MCAFFPFCFLDISFVCLFACRKWSSRERKWQRYKSQWARTLSDITNGPSICLITLSLQWVLIIRCGMLGVPSNDIYPLLTVLCGGCGCVRSPTVDPMNTNKTNVFFLHRQSKMQCKWALKTRWNEGKFSVRCVQSFMRNVVIIAITLLWWCYECYEHVFESGSTYHVGQALALIVHINCLYSNFISYSDRDKMRKKRYTRMCTLNEKFVCGAFVFAFVDHFSQRWLMQTDWLKISLLVLIWCDAT